MGGAAARIFECFSKVLETDLRVSLTERLGARLDPLPLGLRTFSDPFRDSAREERRRVNGDGASSSSLMNDNGSVQHIHFQIPLILPVTPTQPCCEADPTA